MVNGKTKIYLALVIGILVPASVITGLIVYQTTGFSSCNWNIYQGPVGILSNHNGQSSFSSTSFTTVFQSILVAINGSGASICIGPGTFLSDSLTVGLTNANALNGISISSVGTSATIIQLSPGIARPLIFWGSVSNFAVSGITFDGNKANEADAANRNAGELIALTDGSNQHVAFRNVTCQNARNGACLDVTASDLQVTDGRFLNNGVVSSLWGTDGMHIGTSNAIVSSGISVSRNYFNYWTDTGVATDHSNNVHIQDNTFTNPAPGAYGIQFGQAGFPNANVTVTGNTLTGFAQGTYGHAISAGGSAPNGLVYVQNNPGYNPVNLIATPFDTGFGPVRMGIFAGQVSPMPNTNYVVYGVNVCFTSSGGSGVNITVRDGLGNLIYSPGASVAVPLCPFIGWQVNFGPFSQAPTVPVYGN